MGGARGAGVPQADARTGSAATGRLFVAKWNTWNFAGDSMSDGVLRVSSGRTLLNYWSVERDRARHPMGVQRPADARRADDAVARGLGSCRPRLEGDERKPVVWSVDGSYESSSDGSWSGQGEVSFTFKPLPSLSVEIGPELTRQLTDAQYVRTVTDPAVTAMYGKHYVFGAIDQTELVMDTRVNVILSPKMSIQAYIQPLLSVGRYSGFKEPAQPRTYDFLQYGDEWRRDHVRSRGGRVPGAAGDGLAVCHPQPRLQLHVAARQRGLPVGVQAGLDALRRLDAAARGRRRPGPLRVQPGHLAG